MSNNETKTSEKSDLAEPRLFSDINVTMKSGHLVKDPETVGNGKYIKLRFATNREFRTSEGEVKTNTNYFNALVSANLKEAFPVAKKLKKGDWIYLKGEDSTRSFDTPEGYKQTASTIFAYHVVLKKEKNSIPEAKEQADEMDEVTPS